MPDIGVLGTQSTPVETAGTNAFVVLDMLSLRLATARVFRHVCAESDRKAEHRLLLGGALIRQRAPIQGQASLVRRCGVIYIGSRLWNGLSDGGRADI